MRVVKIILVFMSLQVVGCAYFKDGATTRIEFQRKPNDSLQVNGISIPDSLRYVEVMNSRTYTIRSIRGKSEFLEPVQSRFNNSIASNWIAWPYMFIDFYLGSNRTIENGETYKVIKGNEGVPADSCELMARSSLKSSIWQTWQWFLIGSAVGAIPIGIAQSSSNAAQYLIPLTIGPVLCLAGVFHGVYKTINSTQKIKACIEHRVK